MGRKLRATFNGCGYILLIEGRKKENNRNGATRKRAVIGLRGLLRRKRLSTTQALLRTGKPKKLKLKHFMIIK